MSLPWTACHIHIWGNICVRKECFCLCFARQEHESKNFDWCVQVLWTLKSETEWSRNSIFIFSPQTAELDLEKQIIKKEKKKNLTNKQKRSLAHTSHFLKHGKPTSTKHIPVTCLLLPTISVLTRGWPWTLSSLFLFCFILFCFILFCFF